MTTDSSSNTAKAPTWDVLDADRDMKCDQNAIMECIGVMSAPECGCLPRFRCFR